MATTYTASDQAAQPRMYHDGPIVAMGRYQSTVTLSVSDILFAVKVPHGATIIDGYVSGTLDNSATIVKVGVIGTGATLVDNNLLVAGAGATLSATAAFLRFNAASLPQKISLSDDAAVRYAWVTLTINSNGSLTQSSSITVVVEYAMPGAI